MKHGGGNKVSVVKMDMMGFICIILVFSFNY